MIKEVTITAKLTGEEELFQKVNEAKKLMKELHKKINEINNLKIYMEVKTKVK